MTIISDAATIYRDFVTDGVPSSGVHKPQKSKIIDLFKKVAIYPTQVGMSGLTLPAGLDRIHVRGYADITDVDAAADFIRVSSEPSHSRKFRTDDRELPSSGGTDATNGGWWEMVPNHDGSISIMSLGCPIVSAITAFPTYDATSAITKAMEFTGVVTLPPGWFEADPFENTNSTKLRGAGRALTKFIISGSSTAPSMWGLSSDIEFSGFTIEVDPAVIGTHDGLYSTGITIGRYFYASAYDPIRRFIIDDVAVVRTSDTNGVNSLTVIGNVADGEISNIETTGGLNGLVIHWGAKEIGTYGDTITTNTWHPHDIKVRNIRSNECRLWSVFISASYNITVDGVKVVDAELAVAVQAGDVGNVHALAAEADLINSNIHIRGVDGNVVNPVESSTSSAIVWRATGNYEGDWNRTPFRNCSIDGVRMDSDGVAHSNGVFRLWDCMNPDSGGIEIGDVEIMTASGDTTPVFNLGDSSNFNARRLASNGYEPLVVGQVKNATINCDFADPVGTTDSTTNAAVTITGARNTLTLDANIAVDGTTLTFTTGIPVRLYPGDRIRESASPYRMWTVAAFADGAATSVTIEPSTFSKSSSDPVFIDRQIENVVLTGRTKGYPVGVEGRLATSRHINGLRITMDFEEGHLYDVSIQNSDFLDIAGSTFKRGGIRSGADTPSDSRAIDLESCGIFKIRDCEIGVDGVAYTNGIYHRDVNNYNGLIIDNWYGGDFLGDEIAGSATSSSYDTPDRTNTYVRNRLIAGGTVTPVLT